MPHAESTTMGNATSKSRADISATERQRKIRKYVEELEKSDFVGEESVDQTDSCKTGEQDPLDKAALLIDPKSLHYPFENIIMEGGGSKGLAYCGALRCLDELGMLSQIKRIGGSSAGAMTAALLAVGYNADEIYTFLSGNIEHVFLDHSCGYLSLLPNLMSKFGWNPGNKIYAWFGMALGGKMGNPDVSFYELYESKGIELCVVVTNLNLMTAQYCHPKTTPNMPIRDALRMTMAIPGVYAPMMYDNHGQTDVFVDGGLLVNFPINCFDGWYLSMDKQDSFLYKMKSLDSFPSMMAASNRFKSTGPNKTMGFLLYEDSENELMRYCLETRIGSVEPKRPTIDTKLFLKNEKQKQETSKAKKDHAVIMKAVDAFIKVLQKHNLDQDDAITKDELKSALDDEEFSDRHRELLFGKDCHLDMAFAILDKDGNNKIAFNELIQFMEERGVRMQVRFQGYGRTKITSFTSFLGSLAETILTNMKHATITHEDADRTVGINTGHIGSLNFDLVDADRHFVVERAYNATMSFLRYYAAKHPEQVQDKQSSEKNKLSSEVVITSQDKIPLLPEQPQ